MLRGTEVRLTEAVSDDSLPVWTPDDGGLSLGEAVSVWIQSIDSSSERISLSRLDQRGALIGSEESVPRKTLTRPSAART